MLSLKYAPATVVAVALFSCFGQIACAQAKTAESKSGSAKSSQTDPVAQAMMHFSESGHTAVEDIEDARVAIFNGDPAVAKQLMAKAKTALDDAKKEAPTFSSQTVISVAGKAVGSKHDSVTADLVPVDGDVVLAEDYVPSPEKKAHIDKANQYLQKGARKEAMKELRLGEIDVNYNRVWMPIASSAKHLDQAIQLADNGKYYEANLALKAIEDGLTMDTQTMTEDEDQAATAAAKNMKKK